jgi:hypothetical protein
VLSVSWNGICKDYLDKVHASECSARPCATQTSIEPNCAASESYVLAGKPRALTWRIWGFSSSSPPSITLTIIVELCMAHIRQTRGALEDDVRFATHQPFASACAFMSYTAENQTPSMATACALNFHGTQLDTSSYNSSFLEGMPRLNPKCSIFHMNSHTRLHVASHSDKCLDLLCLTVMSSKVIP